MNETVELVLNCLLKLFPVERSIVTLPPVPWSEYVSLNVVAAIDELKFAAPVTFIVPVICAASPVFVRDPINKLPPNQVDVVYPLPIKVRLLSADDSPTE